jgi:acetoin utilization protein AcuB
MEIAHWMTRPVHTVKPLDSILHARELMVQHRVNQLPVVVDGRLIGIITDRDLRDAFPSIFEQTPIGRRRPIKIPEGAKPERIKVELVMTSEPLTLAPKQSVAEAATLMRRERVGALPVVEGERLVGILTRSDILDAFVALSEATRDLLVAEIPGRRAKQ